MENVICKLVRGDATSFGVSEIVSVYLNINMQVQICVSVCKYAGVIFTDNVILYIVPFYMIGIILSIMLHIIHSSLSIIL